MARRIKPEKFDIEVEKALEKALDFDFNNDILDMEAISSVNEKDITSVTSTDESHPAVEKHASYVKELQEGLKNYIADNEEQVADFLDIRNLEQQIALATEDLKKLEADDSQNPSLSGISDFDMESGSDLELFSSVMAEGNFSEPDISQTSPTDYQDFIEDADNIQYPLSATREPVEDNTDIPALDIPDILPPPHFITPHDQNRSTKRPSFFRNTLYRNTTALSAIWTAGGTAAAFGLSASAPYGGFAAFLASTQGILVAAGTIIPVFMFWGCAQLIQRAQELHQAMTIMTGAATRLLEPEITSQDRVTSISQAIRREVTDMDESIDRAVSRASELEALLQDEVNNLEQAYDKNEARIRALIVELVNEREAVSTHADHVKIRITDAKDQLTQEFNSIADHINAAAESFTVTLSETLNARWSEILNEFNTANEGVARQLSQKFIETVQSFNSSSGHFFEELDARFAQIDQHTEDASKAAAERLGARMDDFVKIVHERTDDVEIRFNTLTGRLTSSGKKIIEAVDESVAEIEKRSDDIDRRLRSTADKVLHDFDNTFQKLDDTIIDRGNQSLSAFDVQVNRLENRAHDLPSVFDKIAETTLGEFSCQIDRIEKQFDQTSASLGKNGIVLAETITNSLDEVEKRSVAVCERLQAAANSTLDDFETRFNNLDRTFIHRSNHSVGVFSDQVRKLEEQAENLSSSFDAASGMAIQAVEKRLHQIDNSLSQRSMSLIQSFIDKTEALEKSTNRLNTTLEAHVNRINEAFQLRTRDIAETMDNGRNSILSTIDRSRELLSHEIENVGETVGKLVDEKAGSFIHQLMDGRTRLSDILETESTRIIDTVNRQINMLSRHVSDMEDTLLGHVSSLDEHTREHVESLDQKTAVFEKTVVNSFISAHRAIETHTKDIGSQTNALRDSLIQNNATLNQVLGEQASALEKRISLVRQVIMDGDVFLTNAMNKHVSLFQDSIYSSDGKLKEIFTDHLQKLEDQTGRLKNTFTDNQLSLLQSLDNRISLFQKALASNHEAIETTLSDHSSAILDRAVELQDGLVQTLSSVDEKLDRQGRLLDKRAHELRHAVDHNSTILSDSFLRQTTVITEHTREIQQTLEMGVNNVRNSLENNALVLSETIRERISEISGALGNETRHAETVISAVSMRLVDAVNDAVNDADQKLTERTLFLKDNIGQAGKQLDQGLTTIEARISSGMNMVETRMLETVRNTEQKLSDHSFVLQENVGKIGDLIDTGIGSLEGKISEVTQNTAQNLIEQTENLHFLARELEKAATSTHDSLDTLTDRFSQQLKEATRAAEMRLRSENNTFIDNFSSRTEEAVSAVHSVKSEIENNIANLIDGLETSNGSILTTVNALRNSVHEIDSHLLDVTSEFKQNIGQLTEGFLSSSNVLNDDLQRFTGLSQDALDNISRFSQQFDAHAQLLTKATTILDDADNIFSEKLEARQKAIDTLAGSLVAKSGEIANAMQHYEKIIVSAIKNAEGHAKSSTEKLQLTLSELIKDATGKFEGATEEIRKSSEEIKDELSRTRLDLSRGVRALPAQTKEYTTVMRDAVTEQVKALKELSDIVEESGYLLSVKQKAMNNNANVQKQTSQQTTPISSNDSVQARTAAAITARDESAREPRHSFYAGQRLASSTPASNGTAPSRGWVSNLLARASRDNPESISAITHAQHAEHSAETLQSMSEDIAHAINHNALVHLWQKYRRGQRNISPDHLYTERGRQIFEKIKHKYALDGDFRRSVSQYIVDFERLLGETTRNSANNSTMREYLTSDTGKVYTMLAHVSGRIQ